MKIYYPDAPDRHSGAPTFREEQLEAIKTLTQAVSVGFESSTGEVFKSALVGAGMGAGKTACAVEVILNTKPERCLIVGVRDACGQWAAALADQQSGSPNPREMLQINNTAAGRANMDKLVSGEPGIYYAGLEMLRAQDWETVKTVHKANPDLVRLFGEDEIAPEFTVSERVQSRTFANMKKLDLLISDESHKHANPKSASIKTVRSIKTEAKIALSGTFFGNKFENAHSVTTWLWGTDTIGTKGAWEARWALKEPVMSKDGKRQLTSPRGYPLSKITGERNPGEFVKTLPCYVFMPTPIGDPPEPEVVRVALSPEQRRQYDEMEGQSLTWIPSTGGSKREPLVADLPITQRIRLRTAALGGMTLVPGESEDDPDSTTFEPGCDSSTLTALHEVLHQKGWAGQKALILTHSKSFANETARRMGQKYTVALKTGDTKPSDWDEQKRRFMLPLGHPESIQYLVAVISAVGTATDGLQRNCSKVVWLSEDDNNTNNLQAANRVWRQGVDLEAYAAVKLVQVDTIAEGVLRKNRAHKKSTMDSVAGGQ